jgi:DNA recombination-dependent growth factor C
MVMGFASRSVSIVRYRVKGQAEGSFWDAVDQGIRKGAFRELETVGDDVGMGWTSIDDFEDNVFRGASYVRGNYIGLALRVDTARVPPRVLEMELRKETRKLLEQTGQKRLSSAQRRELKDGVKDKLKRQVFPSIQVYDLIWDTSKAVLYFASLSIKARERLEDLFKKSFGLTLVPLIPYLRAEELLTGQAQRQALENLRPCSMVP